MMLEIALRPRTEKKLIVSIICGSNSLLGTLLLYGYFSRLQVFLLTGLPFLCL